MKEQTEKGARPLAASHIVSQGVAKGPKSLEHLPTLPGSERIYTRNIT